MSNTQISLQQQQQNEINDSRSNVDLVEFVKRRYSYAKTAHDEQAEYWNRCHKMYVGKIDYTKNKSETEKKQKYESTEPFVVVENMLPKLVGDLLNKKDILSVLGRTEDDHNKSDVVKNLIQWNFDVDETIQKMDPHVRQGLIFGTSVGRVYWKYELEEVDEVGESEEVDEVDELASPDLSDSLTSPASPFSLQEEDVGRDGQDGQEFNDEQPINKTYKITANHASVDILSMYDIYFDPDAISIRDAKFVIHRKLLTYDEISELVDQGIYDAEVFKQIPESGKKGSVDPYKSTDLESQGTTQSNNYLSGISEFDPFEILEYWENDRLIVIADEQYVLRNQKNPYIIKKIPFIPMVVNPLLLQQYGFGVLRPIENLVDKQNDLDNLIYNVAELNANGDYVTSLTSDLSGKSLVRTPGGVIPTNSKLEPLPKSEVSNNTYAERNEIRNRIERTDGINEFTGGFVTDTAPKKTATEVMDKSQQGSNRFSYMFKLLVNQSLREFAKWFLWLSQQYMTEEQIVRIVGKHGVEFVNMTPDDIQGEFDFVINIDPSGSDDIRKTENLIKFSEMVLNSPFAQLLLPGIYAKIAELFDLDINDIIDSGQELSGMLNAQNVQSMQNVQGMPGMPGMPGQLPQQLPPF